MPRKARIDEPGALHHIICRGIEQRLIFYDDSEKGNRELGISGTKVGKKSGLSQSAVSRAVQRCEQLVLEHQLSLYDTRNA